jgi:hypothetical protein
MFSIFSSLRSSLKEEEGGGGGRGRTLMMIKQQITTIRIFRADARVCVYVIWFCGEVNKRKKNERKKQQHINLMFNHSSFESFPVIYADRVHTPEKKRKIYEN